MANGHPSGAVHVQHEFNSMYLHIAVAGDNTFISAAILKSKVVLTRNRNKLINSSRFPVAEMTGSNARRT